MEEITQISETIEVLKQEMKKFTDSDIYLPLQRAIVGLSAIKTQKIEKMIKRVNDADTLTLPLRNSNE